MRHFVKVMLKKFIFLLLSIHIMSVSRAQKPNIVFILADDLGYSDLGCYGQKLIETPNIDALSAEGMRFTDFYAGAPVCSPSRSVLMTGLHTGHTTVRGNATMKGGKRGSKGNQVVYRANLTETDFTIGHLMRRSGYKTALMGKWHLDGYDTLATPLHRGFDEFSGWLLSYPETYANGYWPAKRYSGGILKDVAQNKNGLKGTHMDQLASDEAIEFLSRQKNADQPFMLMVNFNNPHSPLDAKENLYSDKNWPEDMKIYASMVGQLDQSVGRIKQYLIETGLSENTILFFCSDNGARSEPTRQLTDVARFFNSSGKLNGFKRDMTDGGIRVPMIVWAPGRIAAGSISRVPGYFADMMPTFAAIAGSRVGYKTDGVDLYPVMNGRQLTHKPRFLYWEFFEGGFQQSVRYGKWKAVKRDGAVVLYDLENDLGETSDVSAQNPWVVRRIEKYLATCRTESPYWLVK
jgi:arylsulfatase A-like enzyme